MAYCQCIAPHWATSRRDCMLYADGTEMRSWVAQQWHQIEYCSKILVTPHAQKLDGWPGASSCAQLRTAHTWSAPSNSFFVSPRYARTQQWGCTPAAAQLEHLRGAMVCTKHTEVPMVYILWVTDSTRVVAALLLHCIHTNSLCVCNHNVHLFYDMCKQIG